MSQAKKNAPVNDLDGVRIRIRVRIQILKKTLRTRLKEELQLAPIPAFKNGIN